MQPLTLFARACPHPEVGQVKWPSSHRCSSVFEANKSSRFDTAGNVAVVSPLPLGLQNLDLQLVVSHLIGRLPDRDSVQEFKIPNTPIAAAWASQSIIDLLSPHRSGKMAAVWLKGCELAAAVAEPPRRSIAHDRRKPTGSGPPWKSNAKNDTPQGPDYRGIPSQHERQGSSRDAPTMQGFANLFGGIGLAEEFRT